MGDLIMWILQLLEYCIEYQELIFWNITHILLYMLEPFPWISIISLTFLLVFQNLQLKMQAIISEFAVIILIAISFIVKFVP